MERPRLRPVDLLPYPVDGQPGFILRDPLSFSDSQLFLSQGAALVCLFLDGQHSIEEIQADFFRRSRVVIQREQVSELIESLDQALMLDSERFQHHLQVLRQRFQEAPERAAFHAGRAYPADPDELRRQLDNYFAHPDGPVVAADGRLSLRGLIAPHIDFRRGEPCYAHAYDALRGDAHDLFVVFGTSHGPIEGYGGYYSVTRKHYETPLGTLETPLELVDALESRLGPEILSGEFAHRSEHSIEFQAVWLQYLFGEGQKVRMMPILCGSFHELTQQGLSPAEEPAIGRFVQALQEEVDRVARNPCYVAGADLAHIGPKFGDSEPAQGDFVKNMEASDRRSLQELERGDAEGFVGAIAAEQDRYRICGISAIYSLAKVLAFRPVKLLKYGYWPDPFDTVSFCSAAVYA